MAGKTRSRNYPAFSLVEALNKAKDLYGQEKRAAVPADVAVKAWGYGGLNGASLRVLGAMKQYGLLDSPAARTVRLSPTALTILLEPEDSQERMAAIREAAFSPAMFGEIQQQYPDDLPSDGALVSWLVRSHDFNEDAARGLIAAYRDTMDLVGRQQISDIAPQREKSDRSRQQAEDDRETPPHKGGRVNPNLKSFSYVLPGNTVATLTLDGELLGERAIKLLGGFLDLVKEGLAAEIEHGGNKSAPSA